MHFNYVFRCIFNVYFVCKVNSYRFFYISNPLCKDWIVETYHEILLMLESVEFIPSFCTYQLTDTLTRPIVGEAVHPLVVS